ncbi:MAG: PAS domain-containing protein [Leptolyngbyaceae cyanobacterium CRU_2_3]|nr:PAS domain-containing protein [Leptolyngbyaceae cyanobacterium CRU_2_3]
MLANQAMANFYGTTVEDLIGKSLTDLYADPAAVNLFLSQNQWVIHNRQSLFIPEEQVESCHSDIEWLQWQKQPIQLPGRDEYGVLGIGVNITARKRSEAALESILQGTVSATGEDFFPVLVQSIVSALGVRHAMITELIDHQTLSTLALWSNDQFHPPLSFDLNLPLPCGRTVEQGLFVCPSHIGEVFPDNQVLEQLEADSYLGVSLQGEEGQVIGVLCIIDDQPLTDIAQSEDLLRIFAARAAAELERKRAIAALQQLNQELEFRVAERTQELMRSQIDLQNQTHLLQAILNSMGDGLIVTNLEQEVLVFNPAACRIVGIGQDEIPADWMTHCQLYLSDRKTPCPSEQAPLARAMRGEVADNVEIYVRDFKRSEDILLDCTIRPFYNKTGQIAGGVAVLRDITDKSRLRKPYASVNRSFGH